MKIQHISYPNKPPIFSGPQVIAIGDFDGVHLGHKELIDRAVNIGSHLHVPVSIMTFHPHPRELLGNLKYSRLLTPLNKKNELFAGMGVHNTYIVDFHSAFMKLSPEQFVNDFLVHFQLNTVIVGFDFTFGYQAKGNPDTLCELSKGRFTVEVVRPFIKMGDKISSTLIRDYLEKGSLTKVIDSLGRPYQFRGIVISGNQRGRKLGYPTANLELIDPYVIPKSGVYAVNVAWRQKYFKGIMNIGIRPTFIEDIPNISIEVHLLAFHEEIYNECLEVNLIAFIRSEIKFNSVNELTNQIQSDIDCAYELLS